jgi:hypothetical protein
VGEDQQQSNGREGQAPGQAHGSFLPDGGLSHVRPSA